MVVALVIGVGVGYFGSAASVGSVTETIAKTNTTTITVPQGGSEILRCVLTQYVVWMIAHVGSNTTSYGSTTDTSDIRTYQTTTSVFQAVGYVTTFTSSYTGTMTGAIARGNYTTCTYISG